MDTATHPRATARASSPAAVPLVVDLDGTLLRTDTLLESLLALARSRPSALLQLPWWLLHGRAHLKQHLAQLAALDVQTLPLARELLDDLRAQKRQGRRLILATGANEKVAHAIASELGLFDAVFASDGMVNLTGARKRDRLVAEFGEHGFDYVGGSVRDVPVWAAARRAIVASPSSHVVAAARRVAVVERVFDAARAHGPAWLAAIRMHHWLKNLLLLVPLLAAHRLYESAALLDVAVGGLAFCLAASGVYLLNDLLDLPSDRRHMHKKKRALASGELPVLQALILWPVLWLAAGVLAACLGRLFLAAVGTYVGLMLAYSMRLKDIAIIDAFVLAIGYTLRVLAGGLAVQMDVSPWLLIAVVALFFGLALLKRYAELVTLRGGLGADARVRAYRVADAGLLAGLGLAAGCVAVAVLALYPVAQPWGHARWPVWSICGLLLYWIGHMWLMAHRGHIRDDPVSFALHDPVSRAFGVLTAAILLLPT
jgi:4-hydroxybenzoate polyprenyltransferase